MERVSDLLAAAVVKHVQARLAVSLERGPAEGGASSEAIVNARARKKHLRYSSIDCEIAADHRPPVRPPA
jgi:hypothetical protein